MTDILASQINNAVTKLSHVMTSHEVLRLVSFGSNFAGNTSAINLAAGLSNMGKKVVIIDLIAANHLLRDTLDINPKYFLEEYLSTGVSSKINNLVVKTKIKNLSVISTEVQYEDINELNSLLETLHRSFDYVVISESYVDGRLTSQVNLKSPQYSVLTIDRVKAVKRRFVRFLNRIDFNFDGYIIVK